MLYYALTRRVKLEKVIEFVKRMTLKDVRSRKSGNLQVTLALVSALIEKCADNLNVFAMQVCEILQKILSLSELPLCKSLQTTYGILCRRLDNGLFSGDKLFVDMFSNLTQQMISVGLIQMGVDSTNSSEWHMFTLLTCRHVFHCLAFNSSLREKFVALCVPILSRAIYNSYSKDMMMKRLKSNLNLELETGPRLLIRVATSRSIPAIPKPNTLADEDSLCDTDLGEEAFDGLKTLFNTLSATQISGGINAIESFCHNEKNFDSHWGTTFLQTCASFIPVQMRFVSLNTLLNRLVSVSENTTASSNLFAEFEHVARYLLALVSLDFNMIGLATSDVIYQLLNLQKHLYLSLLDIFLDAQVARMNSIYSRCICDLSSHIYYFDQVRDSVEEINAQIDGVLIGTSPENSQKVQLLVMTLLDTIFVILEKLSKKSNAIARHRGSLENINMNLLLLAISDCYPKYTAAVSVEQCTELQDRLLEVLLYYLKKEVTTSNEQSADLEGESVISSNKLLVPNYNNYIDNHENIIGRLIRQAELYYAEPSFNLKTEKKVAELLLVVLELTGVNFVRNFIDSFDLWQLKESSTSASACSKDTTAYIILEASLRVLDQLYGDILESSVSELALNDYIAEDIKIRKNVGLWKRRTDQTKEPISPGQKLDNKVSKVSITEFFSKTALSKWLKNVNTLQILNGVSFSDNGSLHSELENDTGRQRYQLSAPQSAESGLGLGSANDISSIYSEILNGHGKINGHLTPDTSRITQSTAQTYDSFPPLHLTTSRHTLAPRVEDLRLTVNGEDEDDHFMFDGQVVDSSSRSVIQRQIQTTNMKSLLNGLYSDDDRKLIV